MQMQVSARPTGLLPAVERPQGVSLRPVYLHRLHDRLHDHQRRLRDTAAALQAG